MTAPSTPPGSSKRGPVKTERAEEVIQYIRSASAGSRSIVVGIDGRDGVGKSTFARRLIDTLGGKLLDVDDYLVKKDASYVSNVDVHRLKRDMDEEVPTGIIAIAGICLRRVLDKAQIAPDLFVYVKGVNADGEWDRFDRYVCDQSIPIGEALDQIGKGETKPGIRDLAREIARYHRDCGPISRADIVYVRESIGD